MIRKAQGSFIKVGYSGSGLSNGNAASLDSSGNAVTADNTANPSTPCIGFIRHLEATTVSGQEYWLSSSGNITNTVPTSGIIQKVGIGLPSNKILVKIDTDIIDL